MTVGAKIENIGEKIKVWRLKRKIARSVRKALKPFNPVRNTGAIRRQLMKAMIACFIGDGWPTCYIRDCKKTFDKKTGELHLEFYIHPKEKQNDI